MGVAGTRKFLFKLRTRVVELKNYKTYNTKITHTYIYQYSSIQNKRYYLHKVYQNNFKNINLLTKNHHLTYYNKYEYKLNLELFVNIMITHQNYHNIKDIYTSGNEKHMLSFSTVV